MKASSESGLWALTISRGATDVICGVTHPVYTTVRIGPLPVPEFRANEKGGHSPGRKLGRLCWRSSFLRSRRRAELLAPMNPTVPISRTACSLTGGEAALILARFYQAPPAGPGRTDFQTLMESDSTYSLAPVRMLVNGNFGMVSSESHKAKLWNS